MYPIPAKYQAIYDAAIRHPHRFSNTVEWSNDAGLGAGPDASATWHLIKDAKGSVTADRTAITRWSAKITCSADSFLVDDRKGVSPYDTAVRIFRIIHLPNGIDLKIPWGVYRVDDMIDNGHTYTLDLYSYEKQIQDARLPRPRKYPSISVKRIITELVTEALPRQIFDWRITPKLQNRLILPGFSGDKDRWAMLDGSGDKPSLAKSLGLEMYMNGAGRFVIDYAPTIESPTDWNIGPSEGGIVRSSTRSRTRRQVFNLIVVTGEINSREVQNPKEVANYQAGLERDQEEHRKALATNPKARPPKRKRVVPRYEVKKRPIGPFYVWDRDPRSLTYAGPDPVRNPRAAGSFGVVPRFYHSPLINSPDEARVAGNAILQNSLGLVHTVSMVVAGNPLLEPGDVVRLDGLPAIVDKWSGDLGSSLMAIDTRSIRVDDLNVVRAFQEVEESDPPAAANTP